MGYKHTYSHTCEYAWLQDSESEHKPYYVTMCIYAWLLCDHIVINHTSQSVIHTSTAWSVRTPYNHTLALLPINPTHSPPQHLHTCLILHTYTHTSASHTAYSILYTHHPVHYPPHTPHTQPASVTSTLYAQCQ